MEFLFNWRLEKFFLYIVLHTILNCDEASSFGPSHQPEAYFNGSSYLRLQTIISLKKRTGLSFRTCYGGNLFSQQLNDDLIELSVNPDKLEFIAKTGGKKYGHVISGNFLDNRWHTVYLHYLFGNLTIEVDGHPQLLANASFQNDLLVSPGLYNEGAAVLHIGNQFNGCLLEGPTVIFDPALIKSSHNVVFKPCPIPYESCFISQCEEGYEGVSCEEDIDECAKYKPCVNGTCNDRIANYFCQCYDGFGGKNCSVALKGCINNPCLNDGQCRPYLVNETEHKFNCTCPNGFHGHTCDQVTTMSFSGISQVTINTTRDEGYDIQFRFKTTLGDGLLALGRGLTYYILELSKGRLNFQSSLVDKWEGVFIGSNLNDNSWQKVFVAINSSHLVLAVNEEQTVYPLRVNENNNVSYTSFPVTYIGGVPYNFRKLIQRQPFLVGCTEDVLINGQWVLPQNTNTSWLSFLHVEEKCSREPHFEPNPCSSGGDCTDR